MKKRDRVKEIAWRGEHHWYLQAKNLQTDASTGQSVRLGSVICIPPIPGSGQPTMGRIIFTLLWRPFEPRVKNFELIHRDQCLKCLAGEGEFIFDPDAKIEYPNTFRCSYRYDRNMGFVPSAVRATVKLCKLLGVDLDQRYEGLLPSSMRGKKWIQIYTAQRLNEVWYKNRWVDQAAFLDLFINDTIEDQLK